MNELVKNENGKLRVSGRLLHQECKVEQAFMHWMPKQIENVDAEEGAYDIVWISTNNNNDVFKNIVKHTDDINSNSMVRRGYQMDYILDIELAKEICMVMGIAPRTNLETKRLSKETRKYFIECEKKLKEKDKKKDLLLAIYEGGQNAISASKELTKLEVQEATAPLLAEIEELSPLAKKYNIFLDTEGLTDIDTFTKNLGIKGLGRNNMYKYLRDNEYLRKDNKPYQKYIDSKLFIIKPSGYHTVNGEVIQDYKTFLTTKGINKIINKLVSDKYIDIK